MLRLAEPPTGRARLRSSLKSPRNPITPFETSRVVTLHPGLYTRFREGARRVIGATAKPLYAIDGKAIGLDRRSPQTSLFEGGGPPAGGGRSERRSARPRGLGGDFEFLPLKSPRNPITPIETSRVATLHPGLYTRLREGARRVIGATAKPLYAIDGKAVGLDRRSPQTSLIEGGGTARRRWKE